MFPFPQNPQNPPVCGPGMDSDRPDIFESAHFVLKNGTWAEFLCGNHPFYLDKTTTLHNSFFLIRLTSLVAKKTMLFTTVFATCRNLGAPEPWSGFF